MSASVCYIAARASKDPPATVGPEASVNTITPLFYAITGSTPWSEGGEDEEDDAFHGGTASSKFFQRGDGSDGDGADVDGAFFDEDILNLQL